MPRITVFTPTYNRAYILKNLYESLCRQTFTDFEWLIVDDGSTDNTEALVQGWGQQQRLNLRYFRQPNGGKHVAVNHGVKEARGEAFFIVDSDDYLADNALFWIDKKFSEIQDDDRFAGISGLKVFPNGKSISQGWQKDEIDANALDIRYTYHVQGDLAEVFKTDVLRQYPFPEGNGEKFCPEALVWNRIARRYLIRYVQKPIYVGEYRFDGLSASTIRVRQSSPQNTMTYYAELSRTSVPRSIRIKAAINFWRFFEPLSAGKADFADMKKKFYPAARVIGRLIRIRDYRSLKRTARNKK